MKKKEKAKKVKSTDAAKSRRGWKTLNGVLKFDGKTVLKIEVDKAALMPTAEIYVEKPKRLTSKERLSQARNELMYANIFAGVAQMMQQRASETLGGAQRQIDPQAAAAAAVADAAASAGGKRRRRKGPKTDAAPPPAP